ncbi:MAG: adenylate/guanylate cyclase domain-containing protein, partial [bacterium]|nr:adenylate/guanylate cyclase domain-containing protein [bacterium]
LPFIIIPINIALWILMPAALFTAAYATGRTDFTASLVLGIRASMVGLISAAVASFWLESHARSRLIPFFFPEGRLTDDEGVARLSISRRIRMAFRMSGLTPIAILIVTMWTLQLEVDPALVSASEHGQRILVFALVLFAVFFVGGSALNRLISRSISAPIGHLLDAITRVRKGDLETRVEVVSSDEIGVLGDATNEMIRGLAERELLSDAFGRYVSPEVRDEILSGRIPLDGELKDVTVLFADLRDFTPLTESNDPKLVVEMLNGYFGEMAAAINGHGGLILQFLGDEIYAVFGAPVHQSDHPTRAARSALEMSRRLIDLNRRFSERGWPALGHGIGIHTGEVLAANIGSPDRLSYLLVGDTVNLASRLQAATRELGVEIVLSAATCKRLAADELDPRTPTPLPPISVKGRGQPVEIFTLD